MSKSNMPSLAALFGLLALAGYQNRDKIGALLKGAAGAGASGADAAGGALGGMVKSVTGMFGEAGHGAAADSWVGKGANQDVTADQTASALGPDIIDTLVKQTGLTREELLTRLSQILPHAVDSMTPDGKLPA